MPIEWAATIANLAHAYSERIEGEPKQNIEKAIDFYQQSLQVRTREAMPTEWAQVMTELGAAFRSRIEGSPAQNIEEAISAYQQALQIITKDTTPIDWAANMMGLAHAYRNRIEGDRAQNIEEAISAYQQTLQVRTRDRIPDEWARTTVGLANAYFNRIRGNRAQNIENAIEAYQQALQIITKDTFPIDWALAKNGLASAYRNRIKGDRAQNIENAIDAFQESLQVYTRSAIPVQWAETMNNLAIAYSSRLRGDKEQNIENAIEALLGSLEVITMEGMPVKWATLMMNLATSYLRRISGNREQNIEDAINACRQSLQVVTRESVPIKWAETMLNLGNIYIDRLRGVQEENIEEAIDAFQQSLQVMTQEAMPTHWALAMNNLAAAYAMRLRGEPAKNIENAITTFEQVLEIYQPTQFPSSCRNAAVFLGKLYTDIQRWDKANTSYEKALKAADILYESSLSLSSREGELSENRDLFRQAAYARARAGDLEGAVVSIERGRARGLSEILERDRAELSTLKTSAPKIYEQYQQAAATLRQLESQERDLDPLAAHPQQPVKSLSDVSQQVVIARQDLDDAIVAIRKISGYEDFLDKPDFKSIATAVQPDKPIVYIVSTSNGSVALILHQNSDNGQVIVLPIWLDVLTDDVLSELIASSSETSEGWFGASNNLEAAYSNLTKIQKNLKEAQDSEDFEIISKRQKEVDEAQKSFREAQRAWLNKIEYVTRQLWDLVMGSVCDHLTELKFTKAVLIPTSFLNFLPLHAAWAEAPNIPARRRYALDNITFTYAPNARSLQTARAVSKGTLANSLLAINEPQPTTSSPLPHSEREVKVAIKYFKERHCVLKHEQAIRNTVLSTLPDYDVLHFSCHGYVNFARPLDSGLLMSNDEILSLRDFFNTDLQGVRLAILSACDTGLSGTKLPDEVVSLPTGLLQAGVAGIVASLWSVADLSTMILLTRFYYCWQIEGLEISQALQQAQKWVRDTTNSEKATYFKDFAPTQSTKGMPASVADHLYKSLILSEPNARDFAHPLHWAAFAYVGV
ncbi:MAG: CHAT domain-containing tetratricopeptide repeat protein [Cyanobacteria bacterium J06560_5]